MPDRRARPVRDAFVQLGLVAVAVLVYFGVRGRTEGAQAAATDHARDLLRLEAWFGLDVERGIQRLIVDTSWLMTVVNWVYIWGHWPVIAGCSVWLYRRRRDLYIRCRDSLIVSGLIGIVIFATFPVAPPRLAGLGLIDTVTVHSHSYRVLQPPDLVNRFAAFPSFHVGWNVVLGVVMFGASRRWFVRGSAVALPSAMTFAVVATANHFVIDAIAGIAIALFAYWVVGERPLRLLVPWAPRGERVEEIEPIGDQPVHAEVDQPSSCGLVVDAPREDESEPVAQLRDDRSVQQALIDGHAVQGVGAVPTQQTVKLAGAARRGNHSSARLPTCQRSKVPPGT
ncbi:MAG: phosphatase PAP2 family protein [Actinobacteria bacterium]|nr:phosphatase PAP2 family protein [Actinomycetota bacterium]